jgi:hypothetical protein
MRGFSWKRGLDNLLRSRSFEATSLLGRMNVGCYPQRSAYKVEPELPFSGLPILLRPPSLQQIQGGTGILTCFPSSTAFTLDLGTD